MKYSQWFGIAFALLLIASCFMPWAYYPDLKKDFTGLFSEQNHYGRPGVFLIPMTCIAIVFFLIPRIWAKRWNLLIGALIVAYACKSYILFSSAYNVFQPQVKYGMYLMLLGTGGLMLMALLPDLEVTEKKK